MLAIREANLVLRTEQAASFKLTPRVLATHHKWCSIEKEVMRDQVLLEVLKRNREKKTKRIQTR